MMAFSEWLSTKRCRKSSFSAPSIGEERCQDLVCELKQAMTHATAGWEAGLTPSAFSTRTSRRCGCFI